MSSGPVLVGIAFGTPTKGIGVCVVGSDGEVVEGVTVTPDTTRGPAGLITAAETALGHALDITASTGSTERPLVVVEDTTPMRGRGKGARAAAGRATVRQAQVARVVMRDALLGALDPSIGVLTVPPIGDVDAADCPSCLSGTIPAGWRGTRGSRRECERTAWAAAMRARQTLGDAATRAGAQAAPATSDAYPAALAEFMRAANPDSEQALFDAAVIALYVVARPSGAPQLPPQSVVTWARTQGIGQRHPVR